MVHLVLSTSRGNSGNRYFPHHGYLGLTPVRVEGVVRTKLDEDGKPIPARALSISIRCYQSRLTRSRAFRSTLVVDHTDVLWVKPPDREYADVAELEFPFKLTLPKRTPGFSTANYQDYRVFWRLEAVLDHVHIPKVGSRIVRYYDLGLVRYDLSPSPPLKHPSQHPPSTHPLLHQTSKPRSPVLRYNVSVPTMPVGPADVFLATISMQPLDRGVTVRSATVSVERRIDLLNTPAVPTPLVTAGINHIAAAVPSPIGALSPASPTHSSSNSEDNSEDASTPTTSRFARAHDNPDMSPYASSNRSYAFDSVASNLSSTSSSSRPLLSSSSSVRRTLPIPIPRSHSAPSPNPSTSSPFAPLSPSSSASSDSLLKTLTTVMVSADAGSFTCDSNGVWSNTLTLQWPENRGHYRWAVGETMQSDFASVRFFLRSKVVVHGPGGTDTLELDPVELTVVSTNEADRKAAIERWAEQTEGALRSKSKSPWRRRGNEVGAEGPPPSSSASSTHEKSSGYGLPSPPQTPAHSPEGLDGRRFSSTNGSSSKPPRKKTPRRPHTSAGPRDKSNFAYSAPSEMSSRSQADHDATLSRHSASSSSTSHGHSHVGRRLRESGLGESMLNAVEMVKGKSRARESEKRARDESSSLEERDRQRERVKNTGLGLQLGLEREQVRAWEEELARIELQSRRSSAGMLGSWGMLRRRNGG